MVAFASILCTVVGVGFLAGLVVLARRGTDDREQADRDRRFLEEHGHWPDEPPPSDRGTPAPPG
jgi:hypothetical protein